MVRTTDLKTKYVQVEQLDNQGLVHILRFTKQDIPDSDLATWTEDIVYGELTLDVVKRIRITEIEKYDSSYNVNQFTFNEQPMWLNRELRRTLRERIERDEAKGLEETKLIYNNITYTIPVASAKQMLAALEDYATECFDKTAEHKQNISNLESIEAVLAYDITSGYPNKLNF